MRTSGWFCLGALGCASASVSSSGGADETLTLAGDQLTGRRTDEGPLCASFALSPATAVWRRAAR